MKLFIGLMLSVLANPNAFGASWQLSDVSVLLPMPKDEREATKLPSPAETGAKGALIPASVVRELPQLVYNLTNAQTFGTYLRAVGFRFDPCFGEGAGKVTCRRQVRIVWQPIKRSATRGLVTLDAPVHTFHDFDEAGWAALINDYRALLNVNPVAKERPTLDINPRVQAQGFNGAFYLGFKKLILKHCGEQNLTRITIMSVHRGDNEWNFRGWDIANGRMIPISIAQINQLVQNVKTKEPVNFDLRATVAPEGFSRTASAVYKESLLAKAQVGEREMRNFADDVLTIENPRRSNPGTIDCAACHLAGPGAQWLRLNFAYNWPAMAAEMGWTSVRDLTNTTLQNLRPRRMRAFGYFYADPLIAQRTINESALVADELDKTFPRR